MHYRTYSMLSVTYGAEIKRLVTPKLQKKTTGNVYMMPGTESWRWKTGKIAVDGKEELSSRFVLFP